jgi:hypothetical protein
MAKIVTRAEFLDLYECDCGKPLFKITDTSKNICYAKCNYTKEEYDPKKKEWIVSKKQPCGFLRIYHGERPIFKEIVKVIKPKYVEKYNLERELRALFSFLFVTNRTSIIDEINILVRTKLLKEPLKKYYFPTTTPFMKFSHNESYEDYRDRILSEPIIDLSHTVVPKKIVPSVNTCPGYAYLKSIDHTDYIKVKPKTKKVKKANVTKEIYDELQSDTEAESEKSDSDTESENCESEVEEQDEESEEEEETEEVFNEDPVEDYESGGEYDYDDDD